MYFVCVPQSDSEFESYYALRWRVLRKPWGQIKGSEKDEWEEDAQHVCVMDEQQQLAGVGRLHIENKVGIIRYMAVAPEARGRGVGARLIAELEALARTKNIGEIRLNAREEALDFYLAMGYEDQGQGHTLFGDVGHRKMSKTLCSSNLVLKHPIWCRELVETWHNTIPLSQYMGLNINQYTGSYLETSADRDANLNLHGTMFAGSVYSLATLTGWGQVYLGLKQAGLEGDIVLAKAEIKYSKPLSGQPKAGCEVRWNPEDFQPLHKGKKVRFELEIQVMDDNRAVASFQGIYVVLPKS